MEKSIGTPDKFNQKGTVMAFHSKYIDDIGVGPPFAAITVTTLLGRLSTIF